MTPPRAFSQAQLDRLAELIATYRERWQLASDEATVERLLFEWSPDGMAKRAASVLAIVKQEMPRLNAADASHTPHVAHHAETEWSPTGANAIRATCRTCGDCAEAWIGEWTDNDRYERIRAAERTARANLLETCCIPEHRAKDAATHAATNDATTEPHHTPGW